MSDDDKSMDVQLICNHRLVTYNNLQGVTHATIGNHVLNEDGVE